MRDNRSYGLYVRRMFCRASSFPGNDPPPARVVCSEAPSLFITHRSDSETIDSADTLFLIQGACLWLRKISRSLSLCLGLESTTLFSYLTTGLIRCLQPHQRPASAIFTRLCRLKMIATQPVTTSLPPPYRPGSSAASSQRSLALRQQQQQQRSGGVGQQQRSSPVVPALPTPAGDISPPSPSTPTSPSRLTRPSPLNSSPNSFSASQNSHSYNRRKPVPQPITVDGGRAPGDKVFVEANGTPAPQYLLPVEPPLPTGSSSSLTTSASAPGSPSKAANVIAANKILARSSSLPRGASTNAQDGDERTVVLGPVVADSIPRDAPNQRIHYLRAARKASSASSSSRSAEGGGVTGLGIRVADNEAQAAPPSPAAALASAPRDADDTASITSTNTYQRRIAQSLPPLPSPPASTIHLPLDKRSSSGVGGKKTKDEEFSVDRLPEPIALWEASHCYVVDENGQKRRFGEFWDPESVAEAPRDGAAALDARESSSSNGTRPGSVRSVATNSTVKTSTKRKAAAPVGGEENFVPGRKTVVFCIRTFWCGQCQDYTLASLSQLDPAAIHAQGLNVIVIAHGSWKIIKRYREVLKCPFPIYVDQSRRLYRLLGMTKLSGDFGKPDERGAYNRNAVPKQIVLGLKNALLKMPLKNPGNLSQLGGEFVLGPGLVCSFAHRMTNRSDHMEAPDVMDRAGCSDCTAVAQHDLALAQEQLDEIARLQEEEAAWRENRESELDRMKREKAHRRAARLSTIAASDAEPEVEEEMPEADYQATTTTEADDERRSIPRTASSGGSADGGAIATQPRELEEGSVSQLTMSSGFDIPIEDVRIKPEMPRLSLHIDQQELGDGNLHELEEQIGKLKVKTPEALRV